jgi:predicted MPP superfamily phosphohydrolase
VIKLDTKGFFVLYCYYVKAVKGNRLIMIYVYKDRLTINGVSPKRFIHLSDAHLSYAYPTDSKEDIAFSERQAVLWGTEGRKAFENFEDFIDLTKKTSPDALILTGDIIDYYHPSSISYLTKKLKELPIGPLYVYGNHEGASYHEHIPDTKIHYPEYFHLMGENPSFWVKDYGDLLIVGLDNSQREIIKEQFAFLSEQMERGIPIILLMHVPIITKDILPIVEKKWKNSNNEWKDYFLLGTENQSTQVKRFCQLITKPNSSICAIMAGHVHVASKGEFLPGKQQYTAAPGIAWEITINCD